MIFIHHVKNLKELSKRKKYHPPATNLLGFLSLELSVGVGDLDAKLFGTGDDLLAFLTRYVLGDLSAVLAVVHEQKLELGNVVNLELVESVRENVSRLFVASVTSVNHRDRSTESTTDSAINTSGSSPRLGHSHESVGLETLEFLLAFHDLLSLDNRNNLNHLCCVCVCKI